jgi:hypothetical protein
MLLTKILLTKNQSSKECLIQIFTNMEVMESLELSLRMSNLAVPVERTRFLVFDVGTHLSFFFVFLGPWLWGRK